MSGTFLQLPPPANWEEFETLCWDLWKIIWEDNTTQKNARAGQAQHGVDIFGRPKMQGEYHGIQCKCKDNYTNKELSIDELIAEVDKAKRFTPKLTSFYIATTAVRDGVLQEKAREITKIHENTKLFSVTVYSWDDIVELLFLHRPQYAQQKYPALNIGPSNQNVINLINERLPVANNTLSYASYSHENIFDAGGIVNGTTKPTEFKSEIPLEEIKKHTSNEIHESEERIKEYFSKMILGSRSDTVNNTPASGEYDSQLASQLEKISKENKYISDVPNNKCISTDKPDVQDPSNIAFKSLPIVKDKSTINIFKLFYKIQTLMRYKFYAEAMDSAKDLENHLECLQIDGVKPYIHILLSRYAVNCYETGTDKSKSQLEKAKKLLESAEHHSLNSDLVDSIDTLKAIISELEGCGSILNLLKDKINKYAIRARLATLVKNSKHDDAIKLIEDQAEINEYWAEPALIAYLLAGQDEKADKIIGVLNSPLSHDQYIICSVKYAEILSMRISHSEHGCDKFAYRLTAKKIIEVLSPVLHESLGKEESGKGIHSLALEISLKANLILANKSEIIKYSNSLFSHSPIPLMVLESILEGYVPPPPNIVKRIIEEHKTHLNAHLLAAGIQVNYFNLPNQAFHDVKEVVCLVKTPQEQEAYLNCLLDLWQHLDDKLSDECYELAMSITDADSPHGVKFRAGKSLRNEKPDDAMELLNGKPDNDPVVLQMIGNAYLMKKELHKAALCFLKSAELVCDPKMYHKAGDYFLQAKDEPAAIECYEKSISLFPDNIIVRSNLSDIYTRTQIDLKKAITHLTAINCLKPYDQSVLINLASCHVRLYEPEIALKYYDIACALENPNLAAIAAKAELLISMKKEDEAFKHLESFESKFREDAGFLSVYMNTAYFAGFDDKANCAMLEIIKLQKGMPENDIIIKMIPAEEGLELLKNNIHASRKKDSNIQDNIIKGQFPWVWAEEISGNNSFYYGWKRRTQKLKWMYEEPRFWANHTIYSTNAFHPQKGERQDLILLPVKCLSKGTSIVADVSSLITLHQLGMLEDAIKYFKEIFVPEEYLETVLQQAKELLPHQKSTFTAAKNIRDLIDSGQISIILDEPANNTNIITVDEYAGKGNDSLYHIRDVVEPIYDSGIINENIYKNALKVCGEPAKTKVGEPLKRFQNIRIELQTLRTLTNLGIIDNLIFYFKISITQDSKDINLRDIKENELKEMTFKEHYDLWKILKNASHLKFIRTGNVKANEKDVDVDLALSASLLAKKKSCALLVDDRVIQAMTFNESTAVACPAFGTDALIYALLGEGMISKDNAVKYLLTLMEWRFRFIIVSPNLLVDIAKEYLNNPPGLKLHNIAEYVHHCMRDPGLFTGSENTEMHESMAQRLYLTWMTNISELIAKIWKDSDISDENAVKFTRWVISEFLPAAPWALHGSQKSHAQSLTPRLVISRVLINVWGADINKRIEDAMKTIKECFELSDEDYTMIISEALNDTEKEHEAQK